MLKKEISLVTVLLIFSYITSYNFQLGIAYFYGFPKEVISNDINGMLSSGVSLLTLLFLMAGVLKLDFFAIDMPVKAWFWSFFIIFILSYFPLVVFGVDEYLESSLRGKLYAYIIGFSLSLTTALYSLHEFLLKEKHSEFRSKLFCAVFSIMFFPICAGWLYSFKFGSPVSVGDNYYMISSSSDKYIVASCKKEQATYKVIALGRDIVLSYPTPKNKNEIKVCLSNKK